MDISKIIITGTVTRTPQSRRTSTGKTVAGFSMSVERQAGYSFYIDVDVWGKTGESVMQNLTVSGIKVIVEGRLEVQSWTDKTNGEKKSKAVVVADSVQPLFALTQPSQPQQPPQGQYGRQPAPPPAQPPQYGQAPQQAAWGCPPQTPAYGQPQETAPAVDEQDLPF